MTSARKRSRNPEETGERLLKTAEQEFNTLGFHGTDTNRIARQAGYAPQTFYRHFGDKTEIFLAVYERWWQSEADAVRAILNGKGAPDAQKLADTLIAFHTQWRGFRRSLRHLSVEDKRVRAARVKARRAQIAYARAFLSDARNGDVRAYTLFLMMERLCDAVAEGEFADMGFGKAAARRAVIDVIENALAQPAALNRN